MALRYPIGMSLLDEFAPQPTVALSVDLLGLLASQVGCAFVLGVAQVLVFGRVGYLLLATGLFVGGWLWFRQRVRGGGVVGRGRIRSLASRSALGNGLTWAVAYGSGMVVLEPGQPAGVLALGAAAVALVGGLTALGLTLCAGDTAGATQDELGGVLTPGRRPGQLLSRADQGLGPPL